MQLSSEPSIGSSSKVLRKTRWDRAKVASLFLLMPATCAAPARPAKRDE
ncbi:MAG: VF530 family DNA-binding protein [Rubrivivax sp.]